MAGSQKQRLERSLGDGCSRVPIKGPGEQGEREKREQQQCNCLHAVPQQTLGDCVPSQAYRGLLGGTLTPPGSEPRLWLP